MTTRTTRKKTKPPDLSAAYEVITDRKPFWGGRARPEGYIIRDAKKDPAAILAMLDRGWIRKVANAPAA